MLEDLTIGVILCAKNGYKDEFGEDAVKKFMADWTMCPIVYYTDSSLLSLLIRCFTDYIANCGSPRWVMTEYFGNKYKFGYDNAEDEIYTILSCFRMCQVRDCVDPHTRSYVYVNGFHDFKFGNLELQLNESDYKLAQFENN